METSMNQSKMEIPAGGIGDIVALSDEELDTYYGSDELAQVASQGRHGDTVLAHLTPGEMVIPADFLEEPAIKQRLLNFLGEQGVENPEQYLVGSSANSINPNTGLTEFGFLKKLVKKVFSGAKQLVKGVVNVVKKAAKYVLPAVLAATPLGAVYGSALGGGLATLIEGGSFKDAIKAGLMSGATGAIGTLATGGNLGKALNPAGRFDAFGKAVSEGGINAFTKPLSLQEAQQRYNTAPAQPVAQPAPKTTRPFETGQTASSEIPSNVPGLTKPPVDTNISGTTASPKIPSNVPGLTGTSANLIKDQATKSGGGNFFDKVKDFAKTPVGGAIVGSAVPALLSKLADGEDSVSGAETLLGQKTYKGGYELPELYPEVYGFDVGREMVFDENLGKYVYPQFQPSTPDMEFDKYGRPIPRSQESQQPEMFAAAGGAVGFQHFKKLEDAKRNHLTNLFGSQNNPSIYRSGLQFINPYSPMNSTTFGADGQQYSTTVSPSSSPSSSLDQGIETLINNRVSRRDPDSLSNEEIKKYIHFSNEEEELSRRQSPLSYALPFKPVLAAVPASVDTRQKPSVFVTPGPEGTYMGFTKGAIGTSKPIELIKKEAGNRPLPGRYSNARLWGYDAAGRAIHDYNEGGEVFPRRTGGIMPHEGIPNEDSVRAMLMPGEFVMTRDAVRGMGRGDLGRGIKSMYSVMRSLEARDRRMG